MTFIQISYRNRQHNGQNSGSLDMPFSHICTKLFMLSTNIWDSPRIRGMSLKFVDSLSTAQQKQLLVFSAISLYSVMYQECMCEK